MAKFCWPRDLHPATRNFVNLELLQAIREEIDEFNLGKPRDFQIRIKFGMASGPMLMIGHLLVGDSWEDCCTYVHPT
jgi:hypothetical protein